MIEKIPQDIKDAANLVANATNEVDIESFEKGYIKGRMDERYKDIKPEISIVDKLLDILSSYGFKFSHLKGNDNYYTDEYKDFSIVFNIEEFYMTCYMNSSKDKQQFHLDKKHLTLNSLCEKLSNL